MALIMSLTGGEASGWVNTRYSRSCRCRVTSGTSCGCCVRAAATAAAAAAAAAAITAAVAAAAPAAAAAADAAVVGIATAHVVVTRRKQLHPFETSRPAGGKLEDWMLQLNCLHYHYDRLLREWDMMPEIAKHDVRR